MLRPHHSRVNGPSVINTMAHLRWPIGAIPSDGAGA